MSLTLPRAPERYDMNNESKARALLTQFAQSVLAEIRNRLNFAAPEIADPAAPAPDSGVMYYRDNGAGKTQLVVRFPTGAIQVIATEP
jgi:hypothetical protein